ncbi:hypothetical protein CHARACLAT_022464 [Characodon lateralis]|uniref:Integrase core domain-containing protein n=1 Tax=Characodon lateralis TaxID=208331 RepID=A0ABU7E2N2_9TELE|nr:hypothetical protein [Characodon lateralis]
MSLTGVYYDMLEDEHFLDISNVLHIFCCRYVFLPRIQASLDVLSEAWNHHPIRTEQNLTPNQVGQDLNPVGDPVSERIPISGCFSGRRVATQMNVILGSVSLNWTVLFQSWKC